MLTDGSSLTRQCVQTVPGQIIQTRKGNIHVRVSVKNNSVLPHNILASRYRQEMGLCFISIICHRCLTQNNYPSEASFMVTNQLKIVSQTDAFMILASWNKQACMLDCFFKRHI